jgi:hypothetical protein
VKEGLMKVLLVEGAPGIGAPAENQLRAAGHTVVGCEPAEPSSPCRGLEAVGDCPLDGLDIDVAVVSRASGDLAPSERGALCAARHRIPVVVSGNPRHAISFGPGTHTAGSDLVAACEQAARSGVAHVAAIRRELLIAGVVTADDVDGPNQRVSFEVRREPRRLRLVVRAPQDEPRLASITKSAAEALRRFDPHTSVIDVVAETS